MREQASPHDGGLQQGRDGVLARFEDGGGPAPRRVERTPDGVDRAGGRPSPLMRALLAVWCCPLDAVSCRSNRFRGPKEGMECTPVKGEVAPMPGRQGWREAIDRLARPLIRVHGGSPGLPNHKAKSECRWRPSRAWRDGVCSLIGVGCSSPGYHRWDGCEREMRPRGSRPLFGCRVNSTHKCGSSVLQPSG